MKANEIFLVFFFGLVIGVILGPLIKQRLEKILISPVPVISAEVQDLKLPLDQRQILGISSPSEKPASTKKKKTIHFADLINQIKPQADSESSAKKKSQLNQSNYQGEISLAVFGDSMVDLMGENLPYLRNALEEYYPQAKLKLFNYGIGSQNISQGLARLNQDYHYKERDYPPLLALNPDIIVLDPFNYNPFADSQDELYRHWAELNQIVEMINDNTQAQVIILATIAPHKQSFGQGAEGVNWTQDQAWLQANRINQYLKNSLLFAQEMELPSVDVYHQSLDENGEGKLEYIKAEDHLHQNEAGNRLIAKLLAEKIYQLKIF